tara:strand:- start:896 stop:1078 length:183 start_codon:yes stop_codon:yes gene_type:complete
VNLMDEWDAEAARHENAPFDGPPEDLPTGIPDDVAPLPDDFDSVPYIYDPATGAWVSLIN